MRHFRLLVVAGISVMLFGAVLIAIGATSRGLQLLLIPGILLLVIGAVDIGVTITRDRRASRG